MRPCDCDSQLKAVTLCEVDTDYDEFKLLVNHGNVFIKIGSVCSFRISLNAFKHFSEWFLREQDNDDDLHI